MAAVQVSNTPRSVQHETIVIERRFDAAPELVFQAFASKEARERWAMPRGDELRYVEDSFTVGGRDVFKCGSPGALDYQGDVRYEDIVPNQRLVYTETVSNLGKRLSACLLTMELVPDGGGTKLIMTAQMAALDGSNMALGYRDGWMSVLGNLAEELQRPRS